MPVSDLAHAHVLALQRLRDGGAGGAFNLGTGHGYSAKQVLDAIAAETGVSLRAIPAARREGDPPVLVSATLAKAELGFEPTMSDLESIIKTAWAWHLRAHPKPATQSLTQQDSP